jgi:hypothetical protein
MVLLKVANTEVFGTLLQGKDRSHSRTGIVHSANFFECSYSHTRATTSLFSKQNPTIFETPLFSKAKQKFSIFDDGIIPDRTNA